MTEHVRSANGDAARSRIAVVIGALAGIDRTDATEWPSLAGGAAAGAALAVGA